jgi:hypothetical protein
MIGVKLQRVSSRLRGECGRLAVFAHQPRHFFGIERVGHTMVEVSRQRGGRSDRHAALQHELHRAVAAGGMDPTLHLPHSLHKLRVAEVARTIGTDTGRLEPGHQRIADERGATTDPLHAAAHSLQPIGAVPLELLIALQQTTTATGMRRDDKAMRQRHRADLNRSEGGRIHGGRHHRRLSVPARTGVADNGLVGRQG